VAVFGSVVAPDLLLRFEPHAALASITFAYLQPPLAATLGIVILGEPLSASLAAATGIILLGVYQTERG
jgi:drug/metabolite transporter (DMT)-like permease